MFGYDRAGGGFGWTHNFRDREDPVHAEARQKLWDVNRDAEERKRKSEAKKAELLPVIMKEHVALTGCRYCSSGNPCPEAINAVDFPSIIKDWEKRSFNSR